MKRSRFNIVIMTAFLLLSCQSKSDKLFNEVKELANFEKKYNKKLIQSGKEEGILETIFEYSIYKTDIRCFKVLENSITNNKNIKKGKYYLNLELDNYIYENNLKILNMNKSIIYENLFDKTYQLYLLSDQTTFVVCKLNH